VQCAVSISSESSNEEFWSVRRAVTAKHTYQAVRQHARRGSRASPPDLEQGPASFQQPIQLP
jgi:hypothetical protein